LTLRSARKEETRRRVLDASRELFEEIGYDAATIRDIAKRAGVSVGSVFTSFPSKAEVLTKVMQDRLTDLYGELDRILPHLRGSCADRCRSMFAVHYAFELRRPRLFLAYISAAFDWSAGPRSPVFGANAHLRGMIRDCLAEGIVRGEIRPDADLDMAVDMLLAAYIWNWRLAAIEGPDKDKMVAQMDQQIGMIFAGLRP